MRVALLTSAGRIQDLAFTLASAQAPDHDWVLVREPEIPDVDVLVSFLNPHVVPAERLCGRAYDVRPGPPEAPISAGEGARVAAATLRRMTAANGGDVLDVWEGPADPAAGDDALAERSAELALGVLLKNLDGMLAGTIGPKDDPPDGVTADTVRAFIGESLERELTAIGVTADDLSEQLDLHATGVVDSFGILELITAVEERFDLEIDFEELDPEDLTVVGPFCRFVAAAAGR